MQKLKSLFSRPSAASHRQVSDDIDLISGTESQSVGLRDDNIQDNKNQESNTKHINELPPELLIHVGTFMVAKDIYYLSLSNKYFLKFFFNMSCDITSIKSLEDNLAIEQEKNEFQSVQLTIWKPLVLMYFPKFYSDLNVENWLHILKRRIKLIVQKSPELLPLGRTSRFPLKDTPFVEMCEFIYKCPMDFSAMPVTDTEYINDPSVEQSQSIPVDSPIGSNIPPPPPIMKVAREVRFCTGCSSKVYQVVTVKEMQMRAQQKQSVYFSLPKKIVPEPPQWISSMHLIGGPPPPSSNIPHHQFLLHYFKINKGIRCVK